MKYQPNIISKCIDSPLGEIVVEALRWGVLAFVSTVIGYMVQNISGVEQTQNIIILTAILRFIDSALHKSGYSVKGLTRF